MLMLSGITPAVALVHLLRKANTGRLVLLLGLATIVNAQPTTKLMPETVEAFDQYVEAVEELMSLRYEGKKPRSGEKCRSVGAASGSDLWCPLSI